MHQSVEIITEAEPNQKESLMQGSQTQGKKGANMW